MAFLALLDHTPASLYDLCFEYLATHLEIISVVDPQTKERRLKVGVTLPLYFCEKLVEFHQRTGESLDDGFATIFENTESTLLKKVRLRNASITDRGLRILLSHNLEELELDNCPSITKESLRHINEFGDNLSSLVIGRFKNRFTRFVMPYDHRNVLQTPNLRRLTFRNVLAVDGFFPLLLKPLPNLDHLDLSRCRGLGDLSYLCKLENLSSLVLQKVEDIQNKLTPICMLKKLRHLDISSPKEKIGKFHNPNQTLAHIVDCLPLLTSLDISGTNLAGTGTEKDSHASKTQSETGHESTAPRTDIPGLASRINNPLEFLGLYKTKPRACHRHSIPAKKISGDANESQIMTAATAYIDRPAVLRNVLEDMSRLYGNEREEPSNVCRVLDFLLGAMDRHLRDWCVIEYGSKLVLHIILGIDNKMIPTGMGRKIVCTTLKSMNYYCNESLLMDTFLQVLVSFSAKDLLFQCERIIDRLNNVVLNTQLSYSVHQNASFILSSLAVFDDDNDCRRILGELGVIKSMLSVIEDRTEKKMHDDVLKYACDIIWATTDRMYDNCQRFVDGDGLDVILHSIKTVIEEREILMKMVCMCVNIAEFKVFRPRIMTSQILTVFLNLLDSVSDANEVSYALVAFLSHMASDGPAAWTISNPKRKKVLRRMVSTIESWDLTIDIDIDHRSLKPFLHLVQAYHTPECQHWAIWTLAHLTHLKSYVYCPMVKKEGGIALLEEVVTRDEPYPRIKELAEMAIKNFRQYNTRTRAGAASGVGPQEPLL